MGQRAPSSAQIAVAVAFAFSCFGLLLYLWNAFGGPVPFAPEGYRVKVPFNEATQLAVESDVRMSNVPVGKVKKIELQNEGENRDLALATIEIDNEYAPIPEDTLAMLRQKTLLGETYVELSQGSEDAPKLEEEGSLPPAQVAESVQLDEIFRTFDDRTQAAFQTWMQQGAIATAGRGADISAAIANLEPFAEDADRLLRVLDTQEEAVQQFVKNTGVVFGALSERQGQLRGLIQNSGTVFSTTARRNEDLQEAFIALPTFLDESRSTLTRLEEFSQDTNPLVTQLRPSGPALSSVLKQIARVAPDFKGFFVGFRKLARRSKTGLPALRRLIDTDLPPLLSQVQPFTQQLGPIAENLGLYKRDVTGLLGNVTSATNAVSSAVELGGKQAHYIRSSVTLAPEGLAVFPNERLGSNRNNAYFTPGSLTNVSGGLPSFETSMCGAAGANANLVEALSVGDPDFDRNAYFSGDTPQQIYDGIKQWGFVNTTTPDADTDSNPAPGCSKQAPQPSIGQIPELTDYQHVYRFEP